MKTRKKNYRFLLFTAVLSAGCLFLTACGTSVSDTNTANTAVQTTADSGAIAVQPAPVTPDAGSAYQNTITVNSSEKVTVTPDIAQVVFSVQTRQKNAADCQAKNTEDVNKVVELLKGLGVAETSIQTSDYTMYPTYDYSNNTQKITGYEAASTLTVSDLPITDLGNILTESVKAGINNIQSITYMSSKYDESYKEALKLAVASAQAKAQALADAGGCTLGSVAAITENSNYSEARYTDNALASKMSLQNTMEDTAVSEANIMPGEMDVEVTITVSYLIG